MDKNLQHKDLLEFVRSRKLFIVLFTFVFFAISSPILAKLMPEIFKNLDMQGITITIPTPTALDAIDQLFKNLGQIGLIVLIFVASGSIVEEKTRKNLEILLTKPISRSSFIISKYISHFIVISGAFSLSAIVFYSYTSTLFAAPNLSNFLIIFSFLLLYSLTIVSVSLFGSTVTKSYIAAIGIAFLAYFLFGSIFNLITEIKAYAPGYVLDNYRDVMIDGWSNKLILPLLVNLAIIVGSIMASIYAFKRQEVER